MRGLIWNCEGLGMSGKFDFLKKIIRGENLDFIGLQETNKKVFNHNWLDSISGQNMFIWLSSPPMVDLVTCWSVLTPKLLKSGNMRLVNS